MAHMVYPRTGPYPNTVMVFIPNGDLELPKCWKTATLAPPPMPPSSNFNITLVGFRYILSCYLGFGEHACTHHYHICVKL